MFQAVTTALESWMDHLLFYHTQKHVLSKTQKALAEDEVRTELGRMAEE